MISKNHIQYDTKKAIIRDGKIVGWWLYKNGGIFNSLKFVGYMWRIKQ